MSLLDESMEECVIVDKTTAPDGYGGVITQYVQGAGITAGFSFDNTAMARVAAVQGATDNVRIFTKKNVLLRSGDVVQRLSNGKTYQVTSNGDDNKTPASAALDARVVTAREWPVTVVVPPKEEETNG